MDMFIAYVKKVRETTLKVCLKLRDFKRPNFWLKKSDVKKYHENVNGEKFIEVSYETFTDIDLKEEQYLKSRPAKKGGLKD